MTVERWSSLAVGNPLVNIILIVSPAWRRTAFSITIASVFPGEVYEDAFPGIRRVAPGAREIAIRLRSDMVAAASHLKDRWHAGNGDRRVIKDSQAI